MAWDIFRYDFQSCGRTMEHQIACFFMSKQALTLQFILSNNSIPNPSPPQCGEVGVGSTVC